MSTLTNDQVTHDTKNVMGLFKASRDLTGLMQELNRLGYNENDMSVIMSQQTRDSHFKGQHAPEVVSKLDDKAPEGFTLGSLSGGVLGAIIGGLTLTGSLLIPGSTILLLGPALGAIAGGAAGAGLGGLVGGLIGKGIPEVEAKFYQDAVEKDENILLVVRTRKNHIDDVERVLKNYDPERINVAG